MAAPPRDEPAPPARLPRSTTTPDVEDPRPTLRAFAANVDDQVALLAEQERVIDEVVEANERLASELERATERATRAESARAQLAEELAATRRDQERDASSRRDLGRALADERARWTSERQWLVARCDELESIKAELTADTSRSHTAVAEIERARLATEEALEVAQVELAHETERRSSLEATLHRVSVERGELAERLRHIEAARERTPSISARVTWWLGASTGAFFERFFDDGDAAAYRAWVSAVPATERPDLAELAGAFEALGVRLHERDQRWTVELGEGLTALTGASWLTRLVRALDQR